MRIDDLDAALRRGAVQRSRFGGKRQGRRGEDEGALAQRPAGGGIGRGEHGGRPCMDDPAAAFAAFWAQFDHPVGGGDHVEVVLDHHHRLALFGQILEHAQQARDFVLVQPRRGLVEHVEGLARAAAFGKPRGKLEALGFAAGERGRGLAQAQVAQPERDERLQVRRSRLALRQAGEERQGLVHRELQPVGGVLAGKPHAQHFGAEAPAVAHRAAQIDIGEKLHLHVLEARAAAGGAAPFTGVEAEAAGGKAVGGGLGLGGEEPAQRVPGPGHRHRHGARALGKRRLVDPDEIGEHLRPFERIVRPRRLGLAPQRPRHGGHEHVLDQGGLARTGHAGDHRQSRQGQRQVDPFEVVFARAAQVQPRPVAHFARGAFRLHPQPAAEIGASERGWMRRDGRRRPFGHQLPALRPRPRSEVDHPVGGGDHLRVVLDQHHGVAQIHQPADRADEPRHVARVQPGGGLFQHEERLHERGAQRRGEVDALQLPA